MMSDATTPDATSNVPSGDTTVARIPPDEATTDAADTDEATPDFIGGETTAWVEVNADPASPPPRIVLGSVEEPEPPRRTVPPGTGRYQLIDEIARGGMGAVMRGRDNELNRMLAVKVLLERFRESDTHLRRFFEEAQIGGQLQHPGIVPIYDLGVLPDRRPFFAMKLVKGQTLSVLLKGRKSPADDLPKFLAIFAQVAQTVAYAHSRGVIHRDLKPLNVMVGAFGEVQVMDWGLAKVLAKARAERPDEVPRTTGPVTEAGDSTLDFSVSVAGSVLGTPAFMAPEQARGEKDQIDERADVFGLGSMLCDILTGAPAYVGRNAAELARKAESADLADAYSRLGACAVDEELVELTRRCLAPERDDRPRDASVVALAVTDYLASVQERLRESELGRVQAEAKAQVGLARAQSEKARRKTTMVTATAALLAILIGGGSWFAIRIGNEQYAAESKRMVADAQARAELLKVEAERDGPAAAESWDRAMAAAENARSVLAARPVGHPLTDAVARNYTAVARAAGEAHARVREIESDRKLRLALDEASLMINSVKDGSFDIAPRRAAYEQAFREAGIVIGPGSNDKAVSRLLEKPDATLFAAGLDGWARCEPDATKREEILDVARRIDPERNKLRDAIRDKDSEALLALARDPAWVLQPPVTISLLANNLAALGKGGEAVAFLKEARRAQPGDFLINHDLGFLLRLNAEPLSKGNSIRYLSVAAGLKPQSPGVYVNLASALYENDEIPEAIAALREAIRLKPDYAEAHANLGLVLNRAGQFADAEAECREAIRLHPDLDAAHSNLGNALAAQGRVDEALTASREAVRLDPHDARAHYGLALVLAALGKIDEAIVEYREAIRHQPELPEAHINLATIHSDRGEIAEAIASLREAIRINPNFATAHYNLGHILAQAGKPEEGADQYREAIRIDPEHAEAHCNLGLWLMSQGKLTQALAELKLGHELGQKRPQWSYPSAKWVADCEALIASRARLEGVLRGESEPKDNADRVMLGRLGYETHRYAAAARFWAAALANDPKLIDDQAAGTRYDAACCAALAGCGRGDDDPKPDAARRADLRKQGRQWLRADLAAWRRISLTAGQGNREAAIKALTHWKSDADLAGVRDEGELARLPEEERVEWKSLWSDVDALLARLRPVH